MAILHRRKHTTRDREALDLLRALMEAPPTPTGERVFPGALRSTSEQRHHALRNFMLRTWVDSLLRGAERLLIVAAMLIFGYWFADGPVRDWLHEQQKPAARAPVAAAAPALAAVPAPRAAPHPERGATTAALLPYTMPNTADAAPADDFMAPRQGAVAAPVAVAAPQPSHLVIPSIQVDTPVQEVFIIDGAWGVAEYAAGYLHGTGLPGEGNTVLAGHAGLRGAVFRDLGSLGPNDDIYLDAGGWRYHYRVRESKSVWPEQIEVLDHTPSPVLTLMTCTNWDTQRLVVVADLVDSKPLS